MAGVYRAAITSVKSAAPTWPVANFPPIASSRLYRLPKGLLHFNTVKRRAREVEKSCSGVLTQVALR